jgi:hypothetical protein
MIRGSIAAVLLAMTISAFGANPAPPTATTTSIATPTVDADSRQTREEFRALLRRYPPELGTVLKLDPTLFANQAYLANYPALANFVAQHPEIAHNTAFYLDHISIPSDADPDPPTMRMWRSIMGDIAGFSVFIVMTFVFVWAIKTLIEQRRWSRLAAIQTEVHSKLLDRFTSNEDLLAYIQTPAGKRFLESAPIPLEAGPRPISAPVGRIFWSLQAGLILIAAGVGFDLASLRVQGNGAQALYAIGVIGILVGIALVISAIVFYALSRRFGLWETNVS